MENKESAKFSIVGFLLFLLPITITVSLAVVLADQFRQKFDNNVYLAIFLVVYILFVSLVFSLIDVIRRRMMVDKPVKLILKATQRIADGDFKPFIEPLHEYGKYDEYDYIIENINKMALELGRSEIMKNDFVSNVSHEIKTPLSIIVNYAKALQNPALSQDSKKKYLDALVVNSKRISDLVTNILRLNKLENQRIKPSPKTVQLNDLLASLVIAYEEKCEEKGIQVECFIDEVQMTTDETLVEIVFNNLLSNAVKFTEKGKIEISLKDGKTEIEFSVKDTGVGMDQAVGERIFDKFYQGETSHSSEGNGLGLALVKKIVDVLGGRIEVQSSLGAGSTFTVKLKK